MFKLNEEQIIRLGRVIKKFPNLKEIAKKFNGGGVKWAIAAGTAVYIYAGGDEDKLDDVDTWIAKEDKQKTAEILGRRWQPQSSERHKAENINFSEFDIFTNCRKFENDKLLLDYCWTDVAEEHLREEIISGVTYRLISPEDVVLLKMANPREKDKEDILKLENLGIDRDYLQERLLECQYLEF